LGIPPKNNRGQKQNFLVHFKKEIYMKNHVILIAKYWPSSSKQKVAYPFLNSAENME